MRDDLIYRADFRADPQASAAQAALMRRVFHLDAARNGHRPRWIPFAVFEDDGTCVASVEAAVLALLLDGRTTNATGLRLAGVDPRRRGQGVFRDLMARVLTWCETASDGPTLLYTEDEGLYAPYGFCPTPQHLLVGPTPAAADEPCARMVGRDDLGALLDRLLPGRAPLSSQCAMVGADDLFRASLCTADDMLLAYAERLDALIAYEVDDDRLTIVDIVATTIPSMAQILGSLPEQRPRVATLFPPDRLAWKGRPVADDTGLMLRGDMPAAMRRPFMLPPTVEF